MATEVTISDLSYRVSIVGSSGFNRMEVTNQTELTLEDPDPDTRFTFEVVSVLNRRMADLVEDPKKPIKLNSTELEYFTRDMKGKVLKKIE